MKKLFLLLLLLLLSFQNSIAQKNITQDSNVKKLTILYTNDLHAHFEPQSINWISKTRKVGGFANIATLVKNEKKQNPNTLYFDAGDYFTGPFVSSLTKGEAIIDAACIGNHEFDHGWQNTLEQIKKAKFPILNGNIFIKNTNNLLWNHPYKILEKNGLKIGVIGLHGKFAFYDTIADEMIQGVEARDEVKYLQKYIDKLKSKVDIIVLLIHEGIPGRQSSQGSNDVARNLQKDIDLAKKVNGLDIIVTGHAHQGTPKALLSNGTIIVSTDALGLEVGKLDIEYSKKKDKITRYTNTLNYLYDDDYVDNPITLKAIQKWEKKLSEITSQKVCTISEPLTRSYGEESFLGDMIADAMLSTFPDFDFALTNSGGIRQDVSDSTVTIGNLISAFPFPNTLVKIEIKGKDLKKLFEHGASLTNGILQVSKGVEMQYDDRLPVGSRIVLCKIKGAPIVDDKIYRILTNNFLADGGDGFYAFKNAFSKNNTNLEIIQSIITYMKTFKVYKPKLFGRVLNINK